MKPIVRWKSISLRGMLLLIVAIALLLGWIANKARQQREAVAALQKFGGFVHYDWEFKNGRVKVPRDNKRRPCVPRENEGNGVSRSAHLARQRRWHRKAWRAQESENDLDRRRPGRLAEQITRTAAWSEDRINSTARDRGLGVAPERAGISQSIENPSITPKRPWRASRGRLRSLRFRQRLA
jgi:hypothetical protein